MYLIVSRCQQHTVSVSFHFNLFPSISFRFNQLISVSIPFYPFQSIFIRFNPFQFLVGEPKLNIWLCLCVCVVSGVPWMDAMLQSVRELYGHNQCVQYRCTHSCGHNIDMNREGIWAWTSALHEHSKFLSQVFQVGFWYCKKQIWSTHWKD